MDLYFGGPRECHSRGRMFFFPYRHTIILFTLVISRRDPVPRTFDVHQARRNQCRGNLFQNERLEDGSHKLESICAGILSILPISTIIW